MASIGHSGMTTEQLTDNIESAVKGVVDKMRAVSPLATPGLFVFVLSVVFCYVGTQSTLIKRTEVACRSSGCCVLQPKEVLGLNHYFLQPACRRC